METKGVISMELTIGSNSFAIAFFVVEVQDNYSVIIGRDWIHVNSCIFSTLHQFLIQWIDDEIDIFLVSPMMDLYPCLCSQLPKFSSEM
jgi:hypothetical protein